MAEEIEDNKDLKQKPAMSAQAQAKMGAKASDTKGTIKKLLTYFFDSKFRVISVILTTLITVAALVTGPKLIGQSTNVIMDGVVSQQISAGILENRVILDKANPPFAAMSNDELLQYFNDNPAALKKVIDNMPGGAIQGKDMIESMTLNLGHGIDFNGLTSLVLIIALLYLLSFCARTWNGIAINRLVNDTTKKMRDQIENKLHSLPLNYIDTHGRGDLMSRATNDLDNLAQSLNQSLNQVLVSVFQVVAVLVMMLMISPLLTLVAVICIPITVIFAAKVMKKSQKQFAGQWRYTGDLNSLVEESFTGHSIVKAYNMEDKQLSSFKTINEELAGSAFKAQFFSGLIQPFSGFISNLSYIVVAIVGGISVSTGSLLLGDIQAFIQYSQMFSQPIGQLTSLLNMLQSGLASAERVFAVLNAEDEKPDVEISGDIKIDGSEIEFKNVYFSYSKDTKLITDFNLKVGKGETVAIVGPTGAGKTTLINLLMRFYDIDKGEISFNGHSINDIPRSSFRKEIGMVLQDTWLFEGTIEDNLLYGINDLSELDDDAYERSITATRIDNIVGKLPDGYETIVSNENETLSQGEKQLITIARAAMSNPQILILDEATSSVDTRTELLVQEAMKKLQTGRTSFVIAHRLSTIQNADTILYLENGNVLEQGNHEELLAKNGKYAALYNSQFQ
jgi:ATP-binding cassette subfamily B protein